MAVVLTFVSFESSSININVRGGELLTTEGEINFHIS